MLDEEMNDGGPLDLNGNGSGLDEFVLFAAIDDDARRRSGRPPRQGCGCALPALALALLGLLIAL
jgi:hypothetical protein